ncbi:MAG: GNAT family N-acetyltransferase [Nocardioidaceae bacterium]
MGTLGSIAYLRPCTEADDAFVYDVFCTTWESEVAALPNQNLAQHVLRIQHIAQERRFAARYPQHQRFLVLEDGEPAGRLYVHETDSTMHVVDLTLMPGFRDRGIGTRIFHDLFRHAEAAGQSITLRVERRNERATMLYSSLGFDLVTVDDLDNFFEWRPTSVTKEGPAGVTKEDATASTKEDRVGLLHGSP